MGKEDVKKKVDPLQSAEKHRSGSRLLSTNALSGGSFVGQEKMTQLNINIYLMKRSLFEVFFFKFL